MSATEASTALATAGRRRSTLAAAKSAAALVTALAAAKAATLTTLTGAALTTALSASLTAARAHGLKDLMDLIHLLLTQSDLLSDLRSAERRGTAKLQREFLVPAVLLRRENVLDLPFDLGIIPRPTRSARSPLTATKAAGTSRTALSSRTSAESTLATGATLATTTESALAPLTRPATLSTLAATKATLTARSALTATLTASSSTTAAKAALATATRSAHLAREELAELLSLLIGDLQLTLNVRSHENARAALLLHSAAHHPAGPTLRAALRRKSSLGTGRWGTVLSKCHAEHHARKGQCEKRFLQHLRLFLAENPRLLITFYDFAICFLFGKHFFSEFLSSPSCRLRPRFPPGADRRGLPQCSDRWPDLARFLRRHAPEPRRRDRTVR